MNRVTKRTWLMGLFVCLLMGGMLFFIWEYATQSQEWIVAAGSPHVYNGGNIGCGTITDRSGRLLLDITGGRVYASDALTRKSTLHWLGDRKGNISASAIAGYAAELSGFDKINGVYSSSGAGGRAELTLSAQVQNAALEALAGRKGTVAVYNYKTGEILCAVTAPTYDPDSVPQITADTSGQYEGVYLNRFVQSTYVPGSIFKVVTAGAAMECVPDILNRSFACTGSYEYGTEAVTCESAHGSLNLKTALAKSCNCSFAQIAELIGKENMKKYVAQFRVVDSVCFDGITTAEGNYDISDTAMVSFAWSCIGQHTDLINPASFMSFMGAIANDGTGVQPYLMSRIQVGDQTSYRAKTVKTDRIMSRETAQLLQSYLRNNVQSIYGDWNFNGLKVCAKSGTSQLGGDQTSNAMFAGFVAEEKYPLAFVVVVENGGYGASTCVPVIARVLSACTEVLDGE